MLSSGREPARERARVLTRIADAIEARDGHIAGLGQEGGHHSIDPRFGVGSDR